MPSLVNNDKFYEADENYREANSAASGPVAAPERIFLSEVGKPFSEGHVS